MCGSGREAILDDREWSRRRPGFQSVVERLSRMSGSGRECLPDVREWSETLLDVRDRSGGPPG